MKTLLMVILLVGPFFASACSRTEKIAPAPPPPSLQAEAEQLQQATAKAAAERARAGRPHESPTPP